MDFSPPSDVVDFLSRLDAFIEAEIKPLETANPEFFDHRREWARTDWEHEGIPGQRWRSLLGEARRRADRAGFYRYPLPSAIGGNDGTQLAMAIIREHLASLGPGLHAELSHEASVVANAPLAVCLHRYGTEEQKARYLEPLAAGEIEMAFGLTEPGHGSDATWLETTAQRDGNGWMIIGRKRFNSGVDVAKVDLVFARTSGHAGDAIGITGFLVPIPSAGFEIQRYHWTFNMPTDHAEVNLDGVRVPDSAVLGEVAHGLDVVQTFVHENRIRQAASSLGAAQFCIDESVRFVKERVVFGRPLAEQQGIQWQLAELQTEAELVRNTVYRTAWEMDVKGATAVSDKVAMVNLRANRLACEAADRAIQLHGGIGYTRHKPFEFIYRHHRRYRITEGSDEVQLRRIAGRLLGFSRRSPREAS